MTDEKAKQPRAGDVVAGRFRIDSLGTGGMGTVFRAVQEPLAREVALKTVRADRLSDATSRERFEREAKLMSALSHAHIAAIHDFGVDGDGTLFLAIELLRGETLRARIARRGALPIESAVRIARDIASALAAAHAIGVVHRDLKPDNVFLIAADERDDFAKLLDFGIAKRALDHVAASTASQTLTEPGSVVGTPGYMAPEVMFDGAVDGRADLYSLGVVMFEMLTGARVFEANNPLALSLLHANEPAPRPSSKSRTPIPAYLDALVLALLAKSPQHRPPSANDVVRALDAAAQKLAPITSTEPWPAIAASEPDTATESSSQVDAPRTTTAWPTRATSDATRSWPAGVVETEVVTRRRRAKTRRRAIAIAAGVTLLAAVAVTAVVVARARDPEAIVTACITTSKNARVNEIMKEARRLERDGNGDDADDAVRAALAVEPDFAPADLRLALDLELSSPTEAEQFAKAAFTHVSELCPRDRALLTASEPYLRPRPDLLAFEHNIAALVGGKYARDVEMWSWLGYTRHELGRYRDAVDAYAHALAVDGDYLEPTYWRADSYLGINDLAGARSIVDECLRRAPTATDCLAERLNLDDLEARCDRVAADADLAIARGSSIPEPLYAKASAQLLAGQSKDAVRAAMAPGLARVAGDDKVAKSRYAFESQFSIAAYDGDFAEAESTARAWLAFESDSEDEGDVAEPADHVVDVLLETGRAEEAGRVAREFLDKDLALRARTGGSDWRMSFYAAEWKGHAIDRARFEELRRAWLAEQPPVAPWTLWSEAWGNVLSDDTFASAAVAAMPEAAPPLNAGSLLFAQAGRALLLAGNPARAQPLLTLAASTCIPLQHPLSVMTATLDLARARLALGDRNGARTALEGLLERWRAATTSTTVTEARALLASMSATNPN